MQINKILVDEQIGEIGGILTDQEKKKAIVIQALQQIQADAGYLPEDAVRELSKHLNLSMSEIFSVASFYKMFYFTPRGKRIVKVCLGTACYVRGSKKVLDAIGNSFDIKSGETTADLSLTLETVGCVGCCGLAPVSTVNDVVVGELVGSRKVENLILSLRED
jgi:NADH:ubiquinone oxidoreductase subunit E